jgi:hypothetical protein
MSRLSNGRERVNRVVATFCSHKRDARRCYTSRCCDVRGVVEYIEIICSSWIGRVAMQSCRRIVHGGDRECDRTRQTGRASELRRRSRMYVSGGGLGGSDVQRANVLQAPPFNCVMMMAVALRNTMAESLIVLLLLCIQAQSIVAVNVICVDYVVASNIYDCSSAAIKLVCLLWIKCSWPLFFTA